jgi:flavin reductase (DIM6/NTAB) family NADH-FMN oxidoreductase RutF
MTNRFDVAAHPGERAYRLLAGLVVPRPIALVTTIDAAGRTNAAPFSFFNVLGTEPPIAGFAPADRDDGTMKDTAANLLATGTCVIHLCDEPLAARMVACARALPPGESEVERGGFAVRAAELVRAPILTGHVEGGLRRVRADRAAQQSRRLRAHDGPLPAAVPARLIRVPSTGASPRSRSRRAAGTPA